MMMKGKSKGKKNIRPRMSPHQVIVQLGEQTNSNVSLLSRAGLNPASDRIVFFWDQCYVRIAQHDQIFFFFFSFIFCNLLGYDRPLKYVFYTYISILAWLLPFFFNFISALSRRPHFATFRLYPPESLSPPSPICSVNFPPPRHFSAPIRALVVQLLSAVF